MTLHVSNNQYKPRPSLLLLALPFITLLVIGSQKTEPNPPFKYKKGDCVRLKVGDVHGLVLCQNHGDDGGDVRTYDVLFEGRFETSYYVQQVTLKYCGCVYADGEE